MSLPRGCQLVLLSRLTPYLAPPVLTVSGRPGGQVNEAEPDAAAAVAAGADTGGADVGGANAAGVATAGAGTAGDGVAPTAGTLIVSATRAMSMAQRRVHKMNRPTI